jgi:LysM repeat protein
MLPPSLTCAGCGTHTIQAGDTFWKLSQANGFSVDAIKAANPGVVPERLQVGQVVNLPCQGGGGNNGGGNPDKGTG